MARVGGTRGEEGGRKEGGLGGGGSDVGLKLSETTPSSEKE